VIASRIFSRKGRVERVGIWDHRPVLVAIRPRAENIFVRISERYTAEELVVIANEIVAPGWSISRNRDEYQGGGC
jgi:hypothetical protein